MKSRSQRKDHWWGSGFTSSGMRVILIVCEVFLLIFAGGTFNAHAQYRPGAPSGLPPQYPSNAENPYFQPAPSIGPQGPGPVPQYGNPLPGYSEPMPVIPGLNPPFPTTPGPGPDVTRRPELYDQLPPTDLTRRPELYDQLPTEEELRRQIEQDLIREGERDLIENSLMGKLTGLFQQGGGGCKKQAVVNSCAECCGGCSGPLPPPNAGKFWCKP